MSTKFCSACGTAIQSGIKFCASCGAAVPAEAAAPAAQPVYSQQQPMQSGFGQLPATPVYRQNAPYPYTQVAQAAVPKKRKGKKALIIIGCIVAFIAIAVVAANLALGNTANADSYKIGKDEIASVKAVVGKRDVVKTETSSGGGVTTRTIVYKTDPDDPSQAAEDLGDYVTHLMENEEFLSLIAFDGLPYEGGIDLQFAKHSADKGKIIILDITYDSSGYTLVFTKMEGTLTAN